MRSPDLHPKWTHSHSIWFPIAERSIDLPPPPTIRTLTFQKRIKEKEGFTDLPPPPPLPVSLSLPLAKDCEEEEEKKKQQEGEKNSQTRNKKNPEEHEENETKRKEEEEEKRGSSIHSLTEYTIPIFNPTVSSFPPSRNLANDVPARSNDMCKWKREKKRMDSIKRHPLRIRWWIGYDAKCRLPSPSVGSDWMIRGR